MVELQNKYQIGKKILEDKLGRLLQLWYRKRNVAVFYCLGQTIIGPLVSSLLFLTVLTLALGNEEEMF